MVFGESAQSQRHIRPDREAKFDNRYGKHRPAKHTPHMQDGAGQKDGGDSKSVEEQPVESGARQRHTDEDSPASLPASSAMDPANQNDVPQNLENDNLEELL